MRQIYNCEQTPFERNFSYETLSDTSIQQMVLPFDSQHSSFDETISTNSNPKGEFDVTKPAR